MLIRCSSSVGANCRASQRAKSTADFINKLKIIEEEAYESCFFLEIILEINKGQDLKIEELLKESNEILAIIVASIKMVLRLKQWNFKKDFCSETLKKSAKSAGSSLEFIPQIWQI